MTMSLRKCSPMIKIVNNSLNDLPSPSNISAWWNFGSLLELCLVTGIFLAMHYTANTSMAFNSIVLMCRDVNYGWLLPTMLANGASVFFICLCLLVGRGLHYGSYYLSLTWTVGALILFAVMATALGYVVPSGQMPFWGAIVITNRLSAILYLGTNIVQWLWGSLAVDYAPLVWFFTLHFLLPFLVTVLIVIHLLFLHQTGSNNSLGLNSNIDKLPFHPCFSYKDMVGFIIMTFVLIILVLLFPYVLGDPDNLTPSNSLVTPVHIQPEWYFLLAYAILRSIPNKLGSVIGRVMSIAILLIMPAGNHDKTNSLKTSLGEIFNLLGVNKNWQS